MLNVDFLSFSSCKWTERVLINTLMNDDDPSDSTPTCKLQVAIFSLIRYTSPQLPNGALQCCFYACLHETFMNQRWPVIARAHFKVQQTRRITRRRLCNRSLSECHNFPAKIERDMLLAGDNKLMRNSKNEMHLHISLQIFISECTIADHEHALLISVLSDTPSWKNQTASRVISLAWL